jgi:hypothetical protein
MIVYGTGWLRRGKVWFDDQPTETKVDLIRYVHRREPLIGAQNREVYTIVTDLMKSPEDLLAGMTKDTRYEIRRAADKDKVTYRCWSVEMTDPLAQFVEFYDSVAAHKNIPAAPASYLKVLARAGVLDLSTALDSNGSNLVWHAYYRGPRRVQLLHSGSIFRGSNDSSFRNLIGRANRYLHWQDMLRFKAAGVTVYDLGGWYAGNSHQEFLRVNQFKQEFGGRVVCEFNCRQLITIKARLADALVNSLRRHSEWGDSGSHRDIAEVGYTV